MKISVQKLLLRAKTGKHKIAVVSCDFLSRCDSWSSLLTAQIFVVPTSCEGLEKMVT